MQQSNTKQKIIAFEGIDGSGKTVQFNRLANYLEAKGYSVVKKEYPVYKSYFGTVVGEYLSGKGEINADEVDPKSMSLWFAMDRYYDLKDKPINEEKQCDFLLINRYVLSNIVYQSIRSANPKKMREEIFELEHKVFGIPVPDLYVFFDVNIEDAKNNVLKKQTRGYLSKSNRDVDVYEESEKIQNDARAAYLECAAEYNNIIVISCVENGKYLSEEEIAVKVVNAVSERLI